MKPIEPQHLDGLARRAEILLTVRCKINSKQNSELLVACSDPYRQLGELEALCTCGKSAAWEASLRQRSPEEPSILTCKRMKRPSPAVLVHCSLS